MFIFASNTSNSSWKNKKVAKKITTQIITTLVITLSATTNALASDDSQKLIDKIVTAYGGETLISLKSLIVHDRYKSITKDGGVKPGMDDVSRLHSTLTVDFEQDRKAVKNWSVQARGKRLGGIMFDGKQGWSINHLRGSHVARPDLNGNNVGAGMMKLLDTTLVRSLLASRETASYDGTTSLFNRAHEKLSFKIRGKSQVTIYVDSSSGLISQMTRPNGLRYVYSEHKKADGITYAADTNQFRSGQTAMMTLSRKIEVNPDISKAFDIPTNTKALEGMQDTSKMVVKALGEGTYLVGMGNRSSLFVDAGDHYVGIGSLGGIKKRLQAVIEKQKTEKQKTEKPLKYMVIPEHQGHVGDVKTIAAMGANFVTVENHLPSLKKQFTKPLSDDRFALVDKKMELADGKVQVHDIATVTRDQLLVFYVPSLKLLYSMDEFGTNLLNSVPSADKRTISFRSAIEELGIDVEKFAYVHGTGLLTIEQLRQITDKYVEGYCPTGHTICAD